MKANRTARRQIAKGFSSKMQTQWGRWEYRNHVVDEPSAPSGLYKACLNKIYSVQFFKRDTDWGTITHLIVRRHDGKAGIPWRHRQRIKNELMGEERSAIEILPPQSRLVDDANCYHIWVLPAEMELPVSL